MSVQETQEDNDKKRNLCEDDKGKKIITCHTPVKKTRICRFYNSFKGCRKGNACNFLHEKMPCAFFGSPQGCSYGDKCPFAHDPNATNTVQLKECPNEGCKSFCLSQSKQCMQCHSIMERCNGTNRSLSSTIPIEKNNNWRQPKRNSNRFHGSNVHMCPEEGCQETCRGRRCRECHFKNRKMYEA